MYITFMHSLEGDLAKGPVRLAVRRGHVVVRLLRDATNHLSNPPNTGIQAHTTLGHMFQTHMVDLHRHTPQLSQKVLERSSNGLDCKP
jgi:hypothetical protein